MSELHCIGRHERAVADLIFVHGLGGHPVLTWCHDETRSDDCWLYWLAEELPGIAVHTLAYEASLSGWLGRAMPLIDRAKDVLTELETMAIGTRPIVFVGHSLGGLLIKQLLREAEDKSVPGWRRITEQTRAVVFLATPHAGADLATWLGRLGTLLRASAAIEDLDAHNPLLRNLNEWYRENAARLGIETHCFYESYPMKGVMVVDQTSADPGITGVVPRPLDADHASICKPADRSHTLYDFLVQRIGNWTAQRERLAVEPAPAGASPRRRAPFPNQLPAAVIDFAGRQQQVEELVQALRGEAMAAAVCGMGGSGKTALALQVAHRLANESPDGRLFIELGGTSAGPLSAAEAMGRVVLSFEPEARLPDAPEQLARLYRSVLDGRRVLILLDDASDAAQIEPLLRWRAPTTRLLMTLRDALALPGVPRLELDVMPAEEARALLREIVGQREIPNAALDLLGERCGYLPIALRVAGTFLAMHPNWTIEEYVSSLGNEGERLELLRIEGAATLDVADVLALSARDLAREQPALAERWQQLAVFPARFDTTAAAAVWDAPLTEARAALTELLRRAMIRYDAPTRRYHWNAFMRDVARMPLATAGDAPAAALERRLACAALRHSAYYHWVLERCERLYVVDAAVTLEGLQLFDRERQQIVAGHAFALGRAGETTGARLLAGYGAAAPYLINLRLHARERVAWHAAAIDACRHLGNRAEEGGRLTGLGNALADCGEVAGAIRCYEEAVALARELGDRQQESVRLGNLGGAYADLGQPRRAIGCFSDALILARLCGDRRAEASHQGNLATAYLALGRHRAALRCGDRALRCAEQVGDRRGQGVYRANLASFHLCLDEVERAVELYRQALAIAEEIGDRRGQGYRAGNLALTLDEQGETTEAATLGRQALELLEELEEEPAQRLRTLLRARFQLATPRADAAPRALTPEADRRSS